MSLLLTAKPELTCATLTANRRMLMPELSAGYCPDAEHLLLDLSWWFCVSHPSHLILFLHNRWSAVKCLEAKHDPSLAKRAPKPAAVPSSAGDAAGPSKPAQKPAPNSAAGQIAGIMAGTVFFTLFVHSSNTCFPQGQTHTVLSRSLSQLL